MTRTDLKYAWLLGLVALLLYSPTLGYDFTNYDDPIYVLENPYVRSLDAHSIRAIFTSYYLANYAPLHLISYSFVHALAGAAPWAYHALNVVLHALCVTLGFLTVRKLALSRGAALLAAAIFLAHPAQVEVVAWISQTKTLLATAFGLTSLLCLIKFREKSSSIERGLWYGFSLLFFVCALLSKPQAVSFPLVYFCVERALPNGRERLSVEAWVPFGALALAAAWVGVLAQLSAGAVKAHGPLGPAGSILGSLSVLVRYFDIALFPTKLSFVYDLPVVSSFSEPRVIGAALLLAIIAVVAWWARKSPGRPLLALGWFVGPLVPVLGWFPMHIQMADRYLYLSLLGMGWSFAGLSSQFKRSVRLGVWLVPLLFALLTLARMPGWQSGEALWDTAVRENPASPSAWSGRGMLRLESEDPEGAEGDFRKAISLDDGNHEYWISLGRALDLQGKTDGAIKAWERALTLDPESDWTRIYLARVQSRRGDYARAIELLDTVIKRRPNFAVARWDRGNVRSLAGDYAGAEADLAGAVALDRSFVQAYESLGLLRERRGDIEGAREAYAAFLQTWTGDPRVSDRVRRRLEGLGR